MPRVRFSDFSRGEVSPKVFGNPSLQANQAGCRSLLNMWTTATGATVKRQGTEYLGPGPIYGKPFRLIPFKFSVLQKYELLFQDSIAFITKDGGFVLVPQPTIETALTTIESLVTGELRLDVSGTTAAVHGLSVGDFVYISDNTPTAFAAARERYFVVKAVPTTATATLENRDGSAISLGTIAATANVTYGKLASFAIPYSEADLFDGYLDYDQSADNLYLWHRGHRTRVVTRTDHHLWTVSNFSATPEEPSVAGLTDTAAPVGALSIQYAVTAINDTTGEESLASVLTIDLTDEPTRNPSPDPIIIEWTKNTNAATYRVYRSINGIFGLLDEARWVSGATVEYTDYNDRVPLLEVGPPLKVENAFDTTGNYPTCGTLFQQRIWMGRTDEVINGLFASRSGSFRSFAEEDVVVDSSPIAQIIAGGVQEIRYIVAAKDILVMTEEGEWGFDKGDQGIITPSSGVISQGDWGTARVKPMKVGNTVVFVERSGRMVRDLGYDVASDGFGGIDLSAASDHLFETSEIVKACYSRKPHKIIFCILADGSAVAMSYDKEQETFGWSRHETAGDFIDCISARDGDVDNIYLCVKRGEDYSLERLNMREVAYEQDGIFLDSWYKRPNSQISGYKSAALLEIREDINDGYKWKIKIGSGDEVENWPCVLDLFDRARKSFPGIHGAPIVLTSDPNPPDIGSWYVINRFAGGAPTWSTETTNEASMRRFVVVSDQQIKDDQVDFKRETFPGSVYYGTGEIQCPTHLGGVVTRNGYVSPSFRGDWDFWTYTDELQIPHLLTDLNSDKVYANVVAGYPYRALIETMEVDPPEEPIEGSGIGTPIMYARVTDAWDFRYMRSSQSQRASTVKLADAARDRYNSRRGLFRSAHIQVPMLSKWDTRSSLVVVSDKPYPLTIQSLGMQVLIENR